MALQTQPIDPGERKASSLTEGGSDASAATAAGNDSSAAAEFLRERPEHRKTRRGNAVWVDMLLLLLLVGLVVGGVFGYRAIRNVYAPDWEEREVILLVEMTAADPAALPKTEALAGAPIYPSMLSDAPPLGVVESATLEEITPYTDAGTAAPVSVLTLRIRSTARYRDGKGYFVGETALLAGRTLTLRAAGVTREGTILALYEPAELTAPVETPPATEPATAADGGGA